MAEYNIIEHIQAQAESNHSYNEAHTDQAASQAINVQKIEYSSGYYNAQCELAGIPLNCTIAALHQQIAKLKQALTIDEKTDP